ncbi:flagellum attachment zone protein 2 [Leishmania tarentolae]|uniref:Flagellum attachment zone protein 2 n=1 Tax=Leishmania tarentolae TaxID=5689 RepID=A0A640KBN7_LEITA|nr:flagellum attachment zone protein 2 [Leishmania tarentolae]
MTSSAPFTMSMEFAPDESCTSVPGSLTISKATLTVFRENSSTTAAVLDPSTNVCLFSVGACSLPLIQFYRHKNVITLMRGNGCLFDNAAVSLGLPLGAADSHHHRASSIDNNTRSRQDTPAMWQKLAMRFASRDDCDRTVEVLLIHSAEETRVPPSPVRSEGHVSRNTSTPTSLNRYSSHTSPILNSRRSASSNRSERPEPRDSLHCFNARPNTPGTEVSTPRSSRLPSRRENDAVATPSSVRIGERTPRSSRLPSRRENEDMASISTPAQSIRSLQHRVAPGRTTTARGSNGTDFDKIQEPQRRHRSSERKGDVSATTSLSHSWLLSSAHRRLIDPAEREFATGEGPHLHSRPHSRHHNHRSHSRASASSRSPHIKGALAAADKDTPVHCPGTPRSARGTTSVASVTTSASALRLHSFPSTDRINRNSRVSPRSPVANTKGEQDAFLRSVQRLQHHRLHFMQHLHKEIVHHAYLVEEAKVKTATVSSERSLSRHLTGSAARGELPEAEAARLREIEARLLKVEALHREAEREREEAARLRREYELKNEEMNARIDGSRDMSDLNSSLISPHHSSVHPMNGQLMVLPQQNGGGSGYLWTNHQGCTMPPEWALAADPAAGPRPDDVELAVAIVDRYIFGEEWSRVYPAYEAEVRFNAQVDICLTMKLSRRLVSITSIVVDRPGLRVTAEIRYDRTKIERDGVERRMNGCPFRFLQRFYDMRDLYDPMRDGAAALAPRRDPLMGITQSAANGRRPSAVTSRRLSPTVSAARRRSSQGPRYNNSDVSEIGEDLIDANSMVARSGDYFGGADDRVSAAEDLMAKRRRRIAAELRQQLADNMAQLEQEEEYLRDRIQLAEAKHRQKVGKEVRLNAKATLTTSLANLEEDERVERAAMEVGAARQLQVLMGGHRRKLALFGLQASEAERRKQIFAQEAQAQRDLNEAMNPAFSLQRKQAKRREREGSALARRSGLYADKEALAAALADVEADELAARAIIRSQAMEALLDLLSRSPAPKLKNGRRAPSYESFTLKALVSNLQADEVAQRLRIVADERRRRALYRHEDVLKREAAERVAIEMAEIDHRDDIVDDMMALNRHQLERRLNDREHLLSVTHEEQFYRKTIVSDEQDAFEVIAELFTVGLKDLLTRTPEVDNDDDDEDVRRRRVSTTRQAKPFHYMTFSPDDMDYPPSAVLAVEGIVGCSINKNLEVVSVARPLPKVEEEDLQLQAGDMILDVAGHSLHSLSHLREVLSNRAMQIQEEALAEFPDVPQQQLTTSPALQKYIEVLCEHHNFLVQVLRGCEIYQIIVRS